VLRHPETGEPNIASGLRFLHSRRPEVGHFDLKPSNVVLTSGKVAKLIDFGLSRSLDNIGCTSSRGTELFRAPEVLAVLFGGVGYGVLANVWSFACVVICLLEWQQKPIIFVGSAADCEEQIRKGSLKPSVPQCSMPVAEMVSGCLQVVGSRWRMERVGEMLASIDSL